jgi:hypothetical protein
MMMKMKSHLKNWLLWKQSANPEAVPPNEPTTLPTKPGSEMAVPPNESTTSLAKPGIEKTVRPTDNKATRSAYEIYFGNKQQLLLLTYWIATCCNKQQLNMDYQQWNR